MTEAKHPAEPSQGKDEVQIDAMELLQFVARLERGR